MQRPARCSKSSSSTLLVPLVVCVLSLPLSLLVTPASCEPFVNGCWNASCPGVNYDPNTPLVLCSNLPVAFLRCDPPLDLSEHPERVAELGYGCAAFGTVGDYDSAPRTSVLCRVFDGIECYGPRNFTTGNVPCITYGSYSFPTIFIYSLLFGVFGVDRLSLGHVGTGIAKLLTLGGFGVWWIVDLVLLATGHLTPADGSCWERWR
ncbi:TM2 domain-containing protein 2 [Capsaspora owczarzaki ATCC 30864]|uniref:TM2 domain-containing protein 2 n=1 Tax=Capsaspora owczarzaki (strain ATCC 30864) TaxID=595528 RepID=A0A0D2WYB2_CAPO3|nr:TM2 domain-containing protein 2 [Capsaspora owczarzaki ATCC 30864]KJE97878.1 TM2 domain-containing protein 2 [Capsaspora owczarzaki ATCC 30864]|eukprot:XP_004343045.1 TM2 domain-containing protein 2 [Capsaspora owczarzaki ATCC 30864]